MARMIPPYFDEATTSKAEQLVFEILKNDLLTANWTVLHSLCLTKRGRKPYGEIDFVLLVPVGGVFCLEVKGGGIKCRDGIWTTTNASGVTHVLKRSPFIQAREGMFEVMKSVKRKFGENHPLARMPFGSAAIFPDVVLRLDISEVEPWEIIDQDDFRCSLPDALLRLIRKQRRKLGMPSDSREPIAASVRELQQFLRPDFEIVVSRYTELQQSEERLLRLTSEQFEKLDLAEDNKRCLFEGPAGTGKTVLARELAKRCVLAGCKTLLVCYNRLLGECLEADAQSPETAGLLTAGRFFQCLRHVIIRSPHGPEFQDLEKKCTADKLFREVYPWIGKMALTALGEKVDVLIVDEAQDLIQEDILGVLDSWLKDGLKRGRWVFFGDFERQAIFERLTPNEIRTLLDCVCGSYVKGRLRLNCRNTRNIAEETALLAGFEGPPYRIGQIEGLAVDYHYYQYEDEQRELLVTVICRLLEGGIKPHEIVVLSHHALENSVFRDLSSGAKFRLGGIETPESRSSGIPVVPFATIHAFKGMESSVVVICDVNRIDNPESQSILYVGMSRARSLLILFLDERVRGSVKAAVERKLSERWRITS